MGARFKVSRAGLELIKGFEGLRRRAARLPDGRWTVGYGHVVSAREGVEISPEDAEALLLYDLLPVVAAVNDLVTVEIAQHQFDALAAFAFNVGVGAFAGSEVLKRVNEGRFTEAALALEVWRNTRFDGRSVTLEALVRRRAAETALFLGSTPWPTPSPRELLRPMVDPAAVAGLPSRPPARAEVDLDGDLAVVRLYEELVPEAPEPAGFTAAQAEAVAQLLAPVEPPEAEAADAPAPASDPSPAAALASAALSMRLRAPYSPVALGVVWPYGDGDPAPVAADSEVAEAPVMSEADAPEAAAEAAPASPATPPPFFEPSPPALVLTPLEDSAPPADAAAAPDAASPAAEEEGPPEVQPPLFGPGDQPERLVVHEAAETRPVRPPLSETGAFLAMGVVGLGALAAAVAAFQLSSSGPAAPVGFDEASGIAWALALIGALLVGLASYPLFKRIGGVDD